MHIPHEKAISKVASSANTSAATIPLAYDQANKEGKFKKGDIIILTALGGGITWGANLLRL
jgi:3-oxoacyl-[acyl-carrier-protein] synthase-3